MKIKSDEHLNPELKKDAQELRGMINKGAEPKRFVKEPCDDRPAYRITDTETGKQVVVPLFALADVMNVLTKLFDELDRDRV